MFNNLGIEWASTLLGCIAFLCVPIPVLFYFYGKKLRQKSKFAPTMATTKVTDDEESGDDVEMHMAALHATRSRAHHELETMSRRSRSRTNGSVGVDNGLANRDPEKND